MRFLPIVGRELRLKARKRSTYYSRCAITAAATWASFAVVVMSAGAIGTNPAKVGKIVFWTSSVIAFTFGLVTGPVVTADCLSAEKRQGTLGLLLLAGLRGPDILLGKLATTSLAALYALIAALPLLAMPFVFGGVTAGECGRMICVLWVTLFLSLASGLFVSALSVHATSAFLGTAILVSVLALGPLLSFMPWPAAPAFWSGVLAFFPGAGHLFLAVADGKYALAPRWFWSSFAVLAMLILLLLEATALLLPRMCHERIFRDRTIPLPVFTRKRRQRLLGGNPVVWLADRTALHSWLTQVFWASAIILGFSAFAGLRGGFLPLPSVFIALYLLHTAVKCWAAWEASRRLAEDKRSGELELLLTTPLGQRRILVGWLIGLKRRFAVPMLVLAALDLNLWWNSYSGLWLLGLLATMGLLVADTYTVFWIGLWMGLNAPNSAQAFLKTVWCVLVLPSFAFLMVVGFLGLFGFDLHFDSLIGLSIVWFLIGWITDWICCVWGLHKLSEDFRIAASRQFESG